jgi:class 3 adenylate cyclase
MSSRARTRTRKPTEAKRIVKRVAKKAVKKVVSKKAPKKTPLTAHQQLERLLAARNEHPERLTDIDRQIWEAFGATCAVWILDMCGFSRLTLRYGITHFLAMIHRLHTLVRPIVVGHGGRVVKTEADNVFAVFPDVGAAVRAARDVHEQLGAANVFLPEDWDLHASIGIGYGDVLLIGEHDFFGSEINIASKLGEDVAGPGEVYLTEPAFQRAAAAGEPVAAQRRDIPVSAMTVAAYLVSAPG